MVLIQAVKLPGSLWSSRIFVLSRELSIDEESLISFQYQSTLDSILRKNIRGSINCM